MKSTDSNKKQLEVEVQCVKSALKGWIWPSPYCGRTADRHKFQIPKIADLLN